MGSVGGIFVKIALVKMVLILIILSAILAPTTSTRPLNGDSAVEGGVAVDQVPVPPIGRSGCTYLPIGSTGTCPPNTPPHW
ncbi:hypothetical protein DITRI_Ditri15bG0092800 [Diplodiscus trichospermus]